MPERARRLGDAVKKRRTQLGMNQGDLQHHGGPGVVAVGQIERGEHGTPQPKTFAKLDTSLGWPPGTAWRVYNGEKVDSTVLYGERWQSPDGTGDPAPTVTVEPEPQYASRMIYEATVMAILNDPFLAADAKNHLANQYSILRQYSLMQRSREGSDPEGDLRRPRGELVSA